MSKTLRASHLAKFMKPFAYTWTHFKCRDEWEKLRTQCNKYFGLFTTKTLALYFAHGKIREEEAWNELMRILNTDATRESKRAQAFNYYELIYAMRDPELQKKEPCFRGNEGIEAKTFNFEPYNLKAKPDGLTKTHVIEIKCPVGKLPNDIAVNYRLQLLVEMACHNKRKAYFYQHYDPSGWYYLFKYLRDQYYALDKLKPNDIVYRPWFNCEYCMLVIFQRVEKVLWAHDRGDGSTFLVQKFWDYCQQEENLPKPDPLLKGEEAKHAWEEHRSTAIYLISQTTEKKLVKHGFTGWQARCIMDALTTGTDIKIGKVVSTSNETIRVLWDGERIRHDAITSVYDKNTGAFEQTVDFRTYRRGIVDILNNMNYQISGREDKEWVTWVQDLKHDHLGHLPPKPMQKNSLHEVELSETRFQCLMSLLKNFLIDLKNGTYPFDKNGTGYALSEALKDLMKVKLIPIEPKTVTRKKRKYNFLDEWDQLNSVIS